MNFNEVVNIFARIHIDYISYSTVCSFGSMICFHGSWVPVSSCTGETWQQSSCWVCVCVWGQGLCFHMHQYKK
jgi:hypothetical protein